jgi:hypothetical protein
MSNQKSRRAYLVDWQVQGALLRQSLLQWLVFALLGALLFAIFQVLLGGRPQDPWAHRLQAVWPMVASLFVSLLMLLPKFVNDSLKLSNRFAGPIVRLRNTLREVGEGKPYRKISFRNSDLWQEIADELDRALAATRRLALSQAEAESTSNVQPVSTSVEGPEIEEPIACG